MATARTTTTVPTTLPKREPDAFQRARSLALRRKALFDKAARLLAEADPFTRGLVDRYEEEEARQDARKEAEQSPGLTPRDGGPLPTDD